MAWIIPSWIPGFGLSMGLLSFFTGLVYPTYQSFRAIETKYAGDDTQWLTYWVVVCTLQVLEKLAWPILCWIPLYSMIRLALLAWMVHPATKGATWLYEELVRPLLMSTADALKDIPVLQPLVADFTPAAGLFHAKGVAPAASQAEPTPGLGAAAGGMQPLHDTFDSAKQQASQEEGAGESPTGESFYQPIKPHAL